MRFFYTLILSVTCCYVSAQSGKRESGFVNNFSKNSDSVVTVKQTETFNRPFFDKETAGGWKFMFSGSMHNDLFADTRRMEASRNDLVGILPLNSSPDADGKDINNAPSLNFYAINTRLRFRVNAPEVLKTKVSGFVEGWFAGVSNADINGFAIRHLYITLLWEQNKKIKTSTQLLFGQTWHPLFTEECFPNTVSGSAAAPFNPFARQPQIRLTQTVANFKILAYINTQMDFSNLGPAGRTSEYVRNSLMPEMGLFLSFKNTFGNTENDLAVKRNMINVGIGADVKRMIPRRLTAENHITRKSIFSTSAVFFLHYNRKIREKSDFALKFKAFYGQNLNDMILVGGYAIRNESDGILPDDYRYTPTQFVGGWLDLAYLFKKFEIGLLGCFGYNAGAVHEVYHPQSASSYYARTYNLHNGWRISPRFKYSPAHFLQFSVEPEFTVASYGNTLNDHGRVIAEKSSLYPDAELTTVWNCRAIFTVSLFF